MGIAKIDDKGRITIPKSVREKLGIKNTANMTTSDTALVITPTKDVYQAMKDIMVRPIDDVSADIRSLRLKAEQAALRAVRKR